MPQLTGRQLPSMIAGLTPIRSAITIGSGIADLVLLPVEQFHRDGRVIRGMQRGTNRFVKTAAMEALKVGSRMAAGAQVILEGVDEFLGGAASPRPHVHTTGSTVVSKYAEQPRSFSEGLSAAIGSLSLNLGHAAETIIAVPTEVSERGSFAPVIKAIPVAVLRPLIGTSEGRWGVEQEHMYCVTARPRDTFYEPTALSRLNIALRNAFLGIRNSIDAQQRVQMDDKYKRRRDSSLGKRRQ